MDRLQPLLRRAAGFVDQVLREHGVRWPLRVRVAVTVEFDGDEALTEFLPESSLEFNSIVPRTITLRDPDPSPFNFEETIVKGIGFRTR